jgi:hypothetical protein
MDNNGGPVTQAQLKAALQEQTEHLVEVMRTMQTELLRGFAAHAQGMTIRMRKLEADQTNLDIAVAHRVEIVEGRLSQIEKRLGLTGIVDA